MRKYLLLMLMIMGAGNVWAQLQQDSIVPVDTPKKVPVVHKILKRRIAIRKDSSDKNQVLKDSLAFSLRGSLPAVADTFFIGDSFLYVNHPFFTFTNPVHLTVTVKQWQGKEVIFYTLIALLIFFAIIRNGFDRYISDLFKIFFRTTVRQRQIKDQLIQSPLPSLLLNLFFLLSTGMFLAFL